MADGRYARLSFGTGCPSRTRVPVSTSSPCSKDALVSTLSSVPASSEELRTEQGRVGCDGRDGPGERAQEDAHGPAVSADRLRTVVLEGGRHVACRVRQRHPQLRAVQDMVSGVENSEWLMPRPAVIRLTSPGRTAAWKPAESRCSISL